MDRNYGVRGLKGDSQNRLGDAVLEAVLEAPAAEALIDQIVRVIGDAQGVILAYFVLQLRPNPDLPAPTVTQGCAFVRPVVGEVDAHRQIERQPGKDLDASAGNEVELQPGIRLVLGRRLRFLVLRLMLGG